jgi:hypothetical protein
VTEGDGQSPLMQLDRAVRVTRHPGPNRKRAEGLPRSALVAEPHGESLGLADMLGTLRRSARRQQGGARVEVEVDGLLRPRATLREMRERVERLLEAGGRLPVGRAP